LDGRKEARRSPHARKLLEAIQVAQSLAMGQLDIFQRAPAIMSRHTPTVEELLAKA
jgi:hypothetical protein